MIYKMIANSDVPLQSYNTKIAAIANIMLYLRGGAADPAGATHTPPPLGDACGQWVVASVAASCA